MKKKTSVMFLLNITFSTAIFFPQRIKRSDIELDYSSLSTKNDSFQLSRHYFVQRLDHFTNEADDRKWLQRYAVSATYYKNDGPAFLFLRGSNPMDEGLEFSGHVLRYAKHLNAICFSVEHRFYGATRPINGSIFLHLTIAQILADVANFVKAMPKEFHLPKNITWIVFGCSFGGVMAAWARRTYPHLIHGAIASSAPVYAKVDLYEYEQSVEESLKSYDPNCIESITMAYEELANIAITYQNMKKILEMFNIDDKIPNIVLFFKTYIVYTTLKTIKNAVQKNDIRPLNISLVCRIMTKYNGTKLEALAEIRKVDMTQKENDMETVKTPIEKSQDQNSANDKNREIEEALNYQRCSEFGHFSSHTNVTFLSRVKYLFQSIETDIEVTCRKFFGPNFSVENLTENVYRTNSLYGGLDFNVSNTIFIHGSLDPWLRASLYQRSNDSLFDSILIKGASHCADTYPPKDNDIPELKNARNTILKTLKSWLEKNLLN